MVVVTVDDAAGVTHCLREFASLLDDEGEMRNPLGQVRVCFKHKHKEVEDLCHLQLEVLLMHPGSTPIVGIAGLLMNPTLEVLIIQTVSPTVGT